MRDENMIASLRACQSGMRQRIEIGREEIAALERDVAILDRAIESLSSPEAVTGRESPKPAPAAEPGKPATRLRECTCVERCRGTEGLAVGWVCGMTGAPGTAPKGEK